MQDQDTLTQEPYTVEILADVVEGDVHEVLTEAARRAAEVGIGGRGGEPVALGLEGGDLEPDRCLAPQFQRTVESTFRSGETLMRFLCDALRIPF